MFLKPKFVLVALMCVLVPAALASGCTGGAFNADNGTTDSAGAGAATTGGSSSSGGTGNGESGDVGTGAGTGKLCGGPEDCNDGQACTTDTCNADGTCGNSPKCGGTQKCCDGDCAECCEDSDCDDGVSCTDNTCFSGQCMYVPNDTLCDKTQYCSTKDGCHIKQACGLTTGEDKDICADDSPCTTDSCVSNLCEHDFCPNADAKLCCEGVGCAACCNDSQCDTDNDPCTVGSCKDGKCNLVPLCGNGLDCCPSADGKTATCGACCSATDCDDKIGCTDDKCGGGQCSHTPGHCDAGYVCEVKAGGCTKAPDCTSPSQCHPSACQTNPQCTSGSCHFDGCANGTKCCAGVAGATSSGCAICCADSECSDNIGCTKDACTANGCSHTPDNTACTTPGQFCDAQLDCIQCKSAADCDDKVDCTDDVCSGGKCFNSPNCPSGFCDAALNKCVTCTSDADCQGGGVINPNIAQPPIGGKCSQSTCEQGMCVTLFVSCAADQTCCPPYGCTNSNFCGIMTE